MSKVIPVILSGGSGTRLWPVSREASPKPFLKLADGETLLGKTLRRAIAAATDNEVITVTNREYFFLTKDEYERAGTLAGKRFLLEPFGRNTAPAIAMAARWASAIDPAATLLVLAADHLIQDVRSFKRDVDTAVALAAKGYLVTFGIKPTAPETGFGYIERGGVIGGDRVRHVAKFVEKPYRELAQRYVEGGNHFWNSGMFCFRVDAFLDALALADPALAISLEECWRQTTAKQEPTAVSLEIPTAAFENIKDISVDYAVMEKANRVAMVEAQFDWSDIGTWNAMQQLAPTDENGNAVTGEAVVIDSKNCYVQSEHRLAAVVGVENLVIVDTPDALLVAAAGRSQDVKKVVDQLKGRKHDAYKLHRTVARPWGTYTVIEEGLGYKIKRIVVKPQQALSLQYHHHRSEHWVVVSGTATVVNGEQTIELDANESTYIPATVQHRLMNKTDEDLAIIEVQCGRYLGEDDIVRLEDGYGRVPAQGSGAAR